MSAIVTIDGKKFNGTVTLTSTPVEPEPDYIEYTHPGFTSSIGVPTLDLWFDIPSGDYYRFELSVNVKPSWGFGRPNDRRSVFWWVLGKNRPLNKKMIGYVFASSSLVTMRQGIDVDNDHKTKDTLSLKMEEGRIYSYQYMCSFGGYTELDVDNGWASIFGSRSIPDDEVITIEPGYRLFVQLGFPPDLLNPKEIPSYGWVYSDLVVRCYPV